MPASSQYILIADFVPLANKGEEAIIRGIEGMLKDDRPVELGLFDNVTEVTRQDNITVFPREWIFRRSGGNRTYRQWFLSGVKISAQMRLGYYSKLSNLVSSSDPRFRPLQEFFRSSDCVIVGHDGVFCVESCGIIHLAKKAGKCAGILGSGGGGGSRTLLSREKLAWGWAYRRAFEESDFCTFRERTFYEGMKSIARSPDKLILAPDPAFMMPSAEKALACQVLDRYDKYRAASEAGRPIVGATVVEKGIVYTGFMSGSPADVKKTAHTKYLSEIFNGLIRERNAFVLFLPHSIEADSSDVQTAQRVVQAMNCSEADYMILDEDLPARLLKAIIKECDFLVGERAHSLIGSVSVATPFMGLTNRLDRRMYGILGEMCDCCDWLIDMNVVNAPVAKDKAIGLFDQRESARRSLGITSNGLKNKLHGVSQLIRAGIVKSQMAVMTS